MQCNHTLGVIKVKAGEVISFTFDKLPKDNHGRITVVALNDIDLSREMADFCEKTDRSGKDIYTENALPDFIESMVERGHFHIGPIVNVHMGHEKRPCNRMLNEYRFSINPESFWEDKLINRYDKNTFTVYNHQNHLLTMMADVEAPFYARASIVDMRGEYLGQLRLSILPEQRHSFINDSDIERIRLALQADIMLNVAEINVMVENVQVASNPDFGSSRFKQHISPPIHKSIKMEVSNDPAETDK